MLVNILVTLALVLPARCDELQFYGESKHFQKVEQTKVGVSNVADIISRALQVGVFVQKYVPPAFLTFASPAPEKNLFVYVPHFNGTFKRAEVSFTLVGRAKINTILQGGDTSETASSLSDLLASRSPKIICASHCKMLAGKLCGRNANMVTVVPKSHSSIDFRAQYQISDEMPEDFISELQFLRNIDPTSASSVFFGLSSFKKVPEKFQGEAVRVLEAVILDTLKNMPENSMAEVLTTGNNQGIRMNQMAHVSGRRKLLATAIPAGGVAYLPGEWLAQVWVSVGGLFVIIAVGYYLAFMDYTQDSVLYTQMNPNLADRRR